MPTTALAVVVAITLIAGMFVTSVTALYRHRLVAASMFAAADFAAIHPRTYPECVDRTGRDEGIGGTVLPVLPRIIITIDDSV